MKRLLLVVLMLMALGGSLLPAAAQDDTLVITTLSDISTMDPAIGYDTLSWSTLPLFYRGLISLADSVTPQAELAESFEISEDGLTYSFTLREGLTFNDGEPLTTEDVKYSFERLLNPETASPTAYFFDMLVGAAEYQAGEADSISGIEIVDDLNVVFNFTRAEWTLAQRFALPPGFIVSQAHVEAMGDTFPRTPMGAGPFIFGEWQAGVRLTGTANPNFFREGVPGVGAVQIDIGVEPSVGILRIENGEADLSLDFVPNTDYPRISTDPALAPQLLEVTAFPNVQYLIPNTREEPFSILEVRRALSIAIDRERLVQIYNGRAVPAAGPIPPNVPGNDAELSWAYDPDQARQLLADAGYAEGFSTTIVTTTDPTDVSIAQAVAADWTAVGVTTEIESVEFAQWLDRAFNQPETMPVAYIGWFMDYQDPSNVYEPLVSCGGSFNPGGYCNEGMDAVFQADKAIPPGEERWASYAELETLLVENVPNINLVHVINYYYVGTRVQGLEADPAYLLDFDAVTLG
jgi:ABC-type transport system substrate-binding protein